jgi:hypothetical protein
MKIHKFLILIFFIFSSQSYSQKAYNQADYYNLFMASFMYMTAAKACNLNQHISTADNTFTKVIAFGTRHNLQTPQSLEIIQNLSAYTSKGIDGFKQTSKISCSEVGKYVQQLSGVASKLN